MAKVHLQRAWYRPKLPVIHYVTAQRVIVRARPARVRNPRTEAQQANRRKLSVASRFLSPLQAFAVEGFPEGKRPNGRPVGAYHMALGHLLNNAMRREKGQWAIDYAHVQLAEGQSLRGFPVKVNRDGRTLRLSWAEGLPEGTRHIRLAFHNAKSGATQCLVVNAPRNGEAVEVLLPKWAKSDPLHMWWTPVVRGETRWRSRYLFLPKDIPIVVGWLVGRSREGAGELPQKGGAAASNTSGAGQNSRGAGAPEASGGG